MASKQTDCLCWNRWKDYDWWSLVVKLWICIEHCFLADIIWLKEVNEDNMPRELVPAAPPLALFGLLFTISMLLFLYSALRIELFAIKLGNTKDHVGELDDLLLKFVKLFLTWASTEPYVELSFLFACISISRSHIHWRGILRVARVVSVCSTIDFGRIMFRQ